MNSQNEIKNVSGVLENFATALNTSNSASLPSFFTEDGIFMPDGIKTISKPARLAKTGENNLSKIGFQIQYTIEDINIDGDFAFVTATANTSQLELGSELSVIKSSRDFFVFKKNGANWKIYRYMFNKIN
jgi:ketosteroid isomerase-like protein